MRLTPTTTQQRTQQRKKIERQKRVGRQKRQAKLARVSSGVTRRKFLQYTAGTGMLLGLAPLLTSCGEDESSSPQPDTEQRTLFFNLAHEDYADKGYFLVGGGQRYELTKVSDQPNVLAQARHTNAFLRAVPDDQITHHIENTVFRTDSVTLCYLGSDIDKNAGTWSMSAAHLQIPESGAAHAYAQARLATPSGPLPMSAKRTLYALAAAQTEQDLREERALVDVTSHAATMVGATPDLMSLEPNSAHNIHSNHIDTDINVTLLSEKLRRKQYGPAMPEQTPNQPNPTGWATLVPLIDDRSGQPFMNKAGKNAGRIQYLPSWHPDIVAAAGAAMSPITAKVKNDDSLGADITGVTPSLTDVPNDSLSGRIWFRHDGSTSVDQSPGAIGTDAIVLMTVKQSGPQNGLQLLTPTLTQSDGRIHVSLTIKNWYVRFLGVHLQFLDDKDPPNVLNLADIPEYEEGTIVSDHFPDNPIDTKTEMFVAALGPIFTILGVPTWPGFIQPSFNVPASAHTVRILASGLGAGAKNYPETLLVGEILTAIISYGLTALMCGVGAAFTLGAILKVWVVPVANALARELIALLSSTVGGKEPYTAAFWLTQALGFAKLLLSVGIGGALGKLVGAIVAALTEAAVEDEIPIAGWIMFGVSVAVGAANLIETSAEVAESPWTYINDLVFTHDLSVSLMREGDTFPKSADHYTVTALFDDGTPHVQTLPLPQAAPTTLPPVVFTGVPLGGKVNVSVAFYQAATVTTANVLLGKGTTGLVPNTKDTAPTIAVKELSFPIGPNTTYKHRQKTTVDGNGAHRWDPTAPAPTINAGTLVCDGDGTACSFRSITVREGTGTAEGYIGYAWQGQNTDPNAAPSCEGGGAGQLDQMANLNTADAEAGYARGPCGFNTPGIKLAYNLLSHGSANFYLDTTDPNSPHVRQVMLEPTPTFDSPHSNRSWGTFNFPPDALLLHPAGHLVSINAVRHKIETLQLPSAPMADADAKVHLLAQVKSGQGTRPGLMTAPTVAGISPDGGIVVLEAGDPLAKPQPIPSRIQAFDLGANPVPFFVHQPVHYFLELTETPNDAGWRYLDLAVEYSGFLYVLSYNENSFVYRLDIYHPTQKDTKPISTTENINAARLAVDFWRNVYTLNYEVLQLPRPGVTEPTVSLWTPTNSCTGVDCTP